MVIFALTAVSKPREAAALAELLVKNRAAACVNLLPGAFSFYEWNGRLRRDGECLLLIKTSRRALPLLKRLLREHHPYELHELVAWPVKEGHAPYLAWVEKGTKAPPRRRKRRA